ncbi:MORC family CW-type zinc finger protein 3 [Corchorus olitorius]|uniref:MORC family CW-type zinc finger protein 3 n=1 Tax=Corchorus olitorius TaxID=93759 RepID=A0A1R3HGG5_9ROSI|nr:MORC family CW-type zinc finger protein 3 [Corchorus olitorius]
MELIREGVSDGKDIRLYVLPSLANNLPSQLLLRPAGRSIAHLLLDIRLRDEFVRGATKAYKKIAEIQNHIFYRIRYSLRAYASMLYLRPFKNFQIILRAKPVQQFKIADELRYRKVITYKPQLAPGSKELLAYASILCCIYIQVVTSIDCIKEAPALAVSGFNVYHKNCLTRISKV